MSEKQVKSLTFKAYHYHSRIILKLKLGIEETFPGIQRKIGKF